MTRSAIVAPALLCFMGASCSLPRKEPVIDASSQQAFENSLVAIGTPLSSKDRVVLGEAIHIVQNHTDGMSVLSPEADNRLKVAGLTRHQIIDRATSIVLDWFEKNKDGIVNYYKAKELREHTIIRIWKYKKMEPAPQYEVTLLVQNNLTSKIWVSRVLIDDVFLLTHPDKIYVQPGKTAFLKGFLISDQPPTAITLVDLNYIQTMPINFQIPDGFNEYLNHIGYELKENGNVQIKPNGLAPKNHPKQ